MGSLIRTSVGLDYFFPRGSPQTIPLLIFTFFGAKRGLSQITSPFPKSHFFPIAATRSGHSERKKGSVLKGGEKKSPSILLSLGDNAHMCATQPTLTSQDSFTRFTSNPHFQHGSKLAISFFLEQMERCMEPGGTSLWITPRNVPHSFFSPSCYDVPNSA